MEEEGEKEEKMQEAKFSIGQVVKHKLFPFRGVVFDVDPAAGRVSWIANGHQEILTYREVVCDPLP